MIRAARPAGPSEVADHYDDLDELYRSIWGEHVHHGLWTTGRESPERAVVDLVRRVADLAEIGPGARVCDVGCGYGATARWLGRERGAEVVGLTLSRAQHDFAVSRAAPGEDVSVRVADWLDNTLAPASFDAVVAIESTEHMADLDRCFAEAARVLVPGGRVVVCAWLACDRPRPWQRRRLLEPICAEGRLAGLGTERDYRAALEAAGLVVTAFEDLTTHVARTWTVCIRRSLARGVVDGAVRGYLVRGRHRVFLRTMFRMRAAYAVGALRYGSFVAVRPRTIDPSSAVADSRSGARNRLPPTRNIVSGP
jgi:tocopherol O-methyltransferase